MTSSSNGYLTAALEGRWLHLVRYFSTMIGADGVGALLECWKWLKGFMALVVVIRRNYFVCNNSMHLGNNSNSTNLTSHLHATIMHLTPSAYALW